MHEILKTSQLFSGLDDRSLAEIATAAGMRAVSRGEILFQEGEQASSFFVVGSGKVKIFKLSPDGKEQILMIAGPGDTFAEAAIFNDGRYPAGAEAIEDAELVVVNSSRFIALLGRNPDLAFSLIARLSQLLRKMAALVEGLSLTDVTTRLAHYLLGLAEEKAGGANEVTLTLAEKKSTLAAQLGTIPETLSRSLSKLSREKLIEVDGPRIRVLDIAGLREAIE